MALHQSFPHIWLISDARNDAVLEEALLSLPRGSGFIFRHYDLSPAERAARFKDLLRLAQRRDMLTVWAGSESEALRHGADGAYGAPTALGRRMGLLRLVTAHSLQEIGDATRAGADAILFSPAFPTRSHPGAKALGPLRFRLLSVRAQAPVIALGGMTQKRAERLKWPLWAAIDGLS